MPEDDGEDRIEALERRLARLEERIAHIETARKEGASEDQAEPSPAAPERSPEEPEPTFAPTHEPAAGAGTASEPTAAAQEQPTVHPSGGAPAQTGEATSLEDRLGADWLAKAGMVTLVLGVAFLLKHAFDSGWIGLTERVVLGVVGGLALWGTGEVLHRKEGYGVYPQILAGGGAAIVYFALFAAYAFEELRAATGMTLELDAILLGATAVGLAGYAVAREMPTLAGLAALLGAATGLVAEAWAPFSVFYTVLLSGAVTAAALWRRWASVAVLALVAAYATLGIQLALGVDPTLVAVATVLLLALFTAAAFRVRPERLEPVALGLVGTATVFALFSATLGPYDTFAIVHLVLIALAVAPLTLVRGTGTALVAALAGTFGAMAIGIQGALPPGEVRWGAVALLAIFGAAAPLAGRREELGRGEVSIPTLLAGGSLLAAWGLVAWSLELDAVTGWQGPIAAITAVAGLGLALVPGVASAAQRGWATAGLVAAFAWPPLQFDGVTTALAWAGLTLAAAAWARLRGGLASRVAMCTGVGLTGLHLLTLEAPELDSGELAPVPGLFAFASATVAAVVAWRAEADDQGEKVASTWALLAVALGLPIVYLGAALDGTWIPIAWASTALVVVVLGFAIPMETLRLSAFALFGLVLGRVFLYDLAALDVVYRIVTFLVVGAILLAASFLYARARREEPSTEAR